MGRHPLHTWIESLEPLRYQSIRAWRNPEADLYSEEAGVKFVAPLDQVRIQRCLLRPSARDLRQVGRYFRDIDLTDLDPAKKHPSVGELKTVWLGPQSELFRGFRRGLGAKRTVFAIEFYLSHGPGYDQHWGYTAYSFDDGRAVVFEWNDCFFADDEPRWRMFSPLGLIDRSRSIASLCLLLNVRARSAGASDLFADGDGPNWQEVRILNGKLEDVDIYRILLAESGHAPDVVVGLPDSELEAYRTPEMNWGYQEIQDLV